MHALQAIVFDLDDTLYPERDYVLSGFCAVSAWAEDHLQIPREQGLGELRLLFESGTRGNAFDLWLERRGIAPGDWIPQMVQIYREHTPVIMPWPEIPELMATLRKSCRLGLVTDGYAAVQRKKLAALGLAGYFEAVVFSDEIGREAWKPSIRPFQAVLERLGTRGDQAVYVGDSPIKDFGGARQVGMWTVRLRLPEGLHSQLESPSPQEAADIETKDLRSLAHILQQRRETQ